MNPDFSILHSSNVSTVMLQSSPNEKTQTNDVNAKNAEHGDASAVENVEAEEEKEEVEKESKREEEGVGHLLENLNAVQNSKRRRSVIKESDDENSKTEKSNSESEEEGKNVARTRSKLLKGADSKMLQQLEAAKKRSMSYQFQFFNTLGKRMVTSKSNSE